MPAIAEPEEPKEYETLAFRTGADWSANDLALVFSALDESYNILVLARVLAEDSKKSFETIARSLRHAHPFFEEWLMMARRGGPAALLPFGGWWRNEIDGETI